MKRTVSFPKLMLAGALIMGILSVLLIAAETARESNDNMNIDPDNIHLVQLEEPEEGAPVASVETSIGTFSFVLYPELSPNAVRNFTELAESGYYDGTYIFNSESGAYSAGGCPQKTGEMPEGYDKSRELVERELSPDLWPFRGAVCALNTTVDRSFRQRIFGGGTYYNGSRLAFINTIEMTDEYREELLSGNGSNVGQAFIDMGGIPNFSQQMTVIGQTYEGLDVVDALSKLESQDNGLYKVPKEDIKIISVKLSIYSKNDQ